MPIVLQDKRILRTLQTLNQWIYANFFDLLEDRLDQTLWKNEVNRLVADGAIGVAERFLKVQTRLRNQRPSRAPSAYEREEFLHSALYELSALTSIGVSFERWVNSYETTAQNYVKVNADVDPEDFLEEIRALVMKHHTRESIPASGEVVEDDWYYLGRVVADPYVDADASRCWYIGTKTKRLAYETRKIKMNELSQYVYPGWIRAERRACFQPGVLKRRAIWLDDDKPEAARVDAESVEFNFEEYGATLDTFDAYVTAARRRFRWQNHIPAVIRGATIRKEKSEGQFYWFLTDESARKLPLFDNRDVTNKKYFYQTLNEPGDVFGEWRGFSFAPVLVCRDGKPIAF